MLIGVLDGRDFRNYLVSNMGKMYRFVHNMTTETHPGLYRTISMDPRSNYGLHRISWRTFNGVNPIELFPFGS